MSNDQHREPIGRPINPTPLTDHLDPSDLHISLCNNIAAAIPFTPFALYGPLPPDHLSLDPISSDSTPLLLSFIPGPIIPRPQLQSIDPCSGHFNDFSRSIPSLPSTPYTYDSFQDFLSILPHLPSNPSIFDPVSHVHSVPFTSPSNPPIHLLVFPLRRTFTTPKAFRKHALDYSTLLTPIFTTFYSQLNKSRRIHNRISHLFF